MADKKCPRCGLWNTGSALRCDCGYDFVTSTVKESYSGQPALSFRQRGIRSMIYGALLFIGGIVVTGVSYAAARDGTYVISVGAIIVGIVQFIKGVMEYKKSDLQ